MRQIEGDKLRKLRMRAGLSREGLARSVGMHWTHLLKLEQGLEGGRPRETTEERVAKLAQALGVEPSAFTSSATPQRSPLAVWAENHGVTEKHANKLAAYGRIEGARKKLLKGRGTGYGKPVWVMDPDAKVLPPTEAQRERRRSEHHLYGGAERTRRSRARRSQRQEET